MYPKEDLLAISPIWSAALNYRSKASRRKKVVFNAKFSFRRATCCVFGPNFSHFPSSARTGSARLFIDSGATYGAARNLENCLRSGERLGFGNEGICQTDDVMQLAPVRLPDWPPRPSNLPLHFLLVRALQNNLRIVSHSHCRTLLIHFSRCHQALFDFELSDCVTLRNPFPQKQIPLPSSPKNKTPPTSNQRQKATRWFLCRVADKRTATTNTNPKFPRKNPIPRNFTTLDGDSKQKKRSHAIVPRNSTHLPSSYFGRWPEGGHRAAGTAQHSSTTCGTTSTTS